MSPKLWGERLMRKNLLKSIEDGNREGRRRFLTTYFAVKDIPCSLSSVWSVASREYLVVSPVCAYITSTVKCTCLIKTWSFFQSHHTVVTIDFWITRFPKSEYTWWGRRLPAYGQLKPWTQRTPKRRTALKGNAIVLDVFCWAASSCL